MTLVPPFRWVGGKRTYAKHLFPFVTEPFGRWIEPFFGAGGAWSALLSIGIPKRDLIGTDLNGRLIRLHIEIRDHPWELLKKYEELPKKYERKDWEKAKRILNSKEDHALFLWVLNGSYGGVYREKRGGGINSAMQADRRVGIITEDRLEIWSEALQGSTLTACDFLETIKKAQKGDLLFVDPPYAGTFSKYQGQGFGEKEHRLLVAALEEAALKGSKVIITNSTQGGSYLGSHWNIKEIRPPKKGGIALRSGEIMGTLGFKEQLSLFE